MAAEKLWNAANTYNATKFSAVRYGNVIGSRGSVIPYFLKLKNDGATTLPITDPEMTRFWITLKQAVKLVLLAYDTDQTGIFVPKLKSMSMGELALFFGSEIKTIGIRVGEKIHESMVSDDETVYMVNKKFKYEEWNRQYDSYNCERLTKEEMKCLIDNL